MKFVMFLLVLTAMVGINALCQEVIDAKVSATNLAANSGDPVSPGEVTSHTRPTKQREVFCACAGKSKAGKGCLCKKHNLYGLSQEEKNLCLKKGIRTYQKCKIQVNMTDKEKKTDKQFSIPI